MNLFPRPHCWIPGSKDGFSDDQKFKVAHEGLLGKVHGISIRSAFTAVDSDKTVTTSNSKFGSCLIRKSRNYVLRAIQLVLVPLN
jgi:hypothetical protein